MPADKVDVEAHVVSPEEQFKAGDTLVVQPDAHDSNCLACSRAIDTPPILSIRVPDALRPILQQCTAPCRGTVRIVKRDAATNKTTSVVVRVCPSDRRVADQPAPVLQSNPAPVVDPDDEEGLRLPDAQLHRVGEDEGIRAHVRDPALQEVIRRIDAAHDREAALRHALGNPNFAAFCSKVLDVVEAPCDATVQEHAYAHAEQQVSVLLKQLQEADQAI